LLITKLVSKIFADILEVVKNRELKMKFIKLNFQTMEMYGDINGREETVTRLK